MTIHEITTTIVRWIKTCDKEEQIDQMITWVIDQFIINPFERIESSLTISIYSDLLLAEMQEQRDKIRKANKTEKQPADDHSKYDYE